MKNNQRKIKKFTAIVILLAFGLSIIGPAGFALTDDLYGHWAEKELRQMQSDGLISGYPDGTFRPDGQITRAEFAALIVRGFNLAKAEGKIFADTRGHWAQDAIATANAHGAVSGYSDSEFGPDNLISREQVAAMIVKAAKLAERKADVNFADQNTISLWAKEAVETALANKLMNGYPDNTFRAKGNATRAEAAVVLLNAMGVKAQEEALVNLAKIEKAGTYGPATGILEIKGDVNIMAAGVTLQNLVIKGDLIIAEEVGDGDVTLNNIKVEGKTYIRGGGKDSIHINGGEYSEIIIERTSEGGVRIVAIDNNNLKIIVAEDAKDEEIILSGEIKSLTVNADGVKITTQQDTQIEELKIQSGLKDVEIDLAAGTNVKEMLVESKVSVKGDGEIEKASGGQAQNSNYENRPDTIVAPPSSGGGSSGGGSTTVAVSAISVKGTGDATTITTDNGTLQMVPTVTPDNASNKAVTWTVTETDGTATDKATISNTGLLTAVKNGTVKVTATAKDGSGKSGFANITITNQMIEKTAAEVAGEITTIAAPAKDATSLTLPTVEEGFTVAIKTSDNEGVIALNGTITPPEAETTVALVLTVTKTSDSSTADTSSINVVVPAKTVAADPEITDFTFTATAGLQEGEDNAKAGEVAGTMSDSVGGTSPFTYSLVAGDGDDDNGKFEIVETDLKIKDNPLTEGTYKVRIQIEDIKGKKFAQAIEITVAAKAVTSSVTSVTVTPKTASVEQGETLQLTANVVVEGGAAQTVTWTSSDINNKVQVDLTGKVIVDLYATAGDYTITATSTVDNTKSDTATITVTEKAVKVTSVTLNKYELNLSVGGEETLTATVEPEDATNKNVTWESNDTSIATVDGNGKVTAVAAGNAVITVVTEDDPEVKNICNVTVSEATGKIATFTVTGDASIVVKDKDDTEVTPSDNKYTLPEGKVTVTVTPSEGKQLKDFTVDGDKTGVEEVTVGSVYTFDMPADNVTVEVTVGEPTKKVKIGGNSVITLKNGSITKDSADKDITGSLIWSYFTEELTMNGYDGGHIHYGEKNTETITIRVNGNANKITAETDALSFNMPNIVGTNKDNDKLTIAVTGSASRAIYFYVNVKNATLDIDLSTSHEDNATRGVDGSATVDGGDLIVKVNKSSDAAKEAYGISSGLTLENGGTANFEVIGAEGTTRISTHNGAPWISDASKVVAEYKTGDGENAGNPLSMTVTVPSTVAKIKSQKDGLVEGESSILIGDSTTVTLYKESDKINSVDTITLSEGLTFYAKTSDNVWFKITIEQ